MSLPQCFDKGLKFGDPEQISYLREINIKLKDEEEMKELGMKLYRVRVYVEGEYSQDVWAPCEEDAIEQVKDEFDIDYCNIDVQYDGEEI